MKNHTTNETKTKEIQPNGNFADDQPGSYRVWAGERIRESLNLLLTFEVEPEDRADVIFEIFEIINNAGSFFESATIAEESMHYIFPYTPEYGEGFKKLQRRIAQEREAHARRLASPEKETVADRADEPKPVEVSSALGKPATAKDITEHHFQIWANKLAYVLESDKVSDEIKSAIRNIFSDAANEVGIHIDNVNLIKPAFVEFMRAAEFGYGNGVLSALQTIIGDLQRLELEGELEQFETRFDAQPSDDSTDTVSGGILEELEGEQLALAISGIINNPHLPEKIYQRLQETFNEIFNESKNQDEYPDDEDTPEYIETILKNADINAKTESEPLDLSDCAPELLNAKISELPTMHDLSCALSGLLHNPLLPAKLYNVITDEISFIAVDNESPENILANLEQMKRGESK